MLSQMCSRVAAQAGILGTQIGFYVYFRIASHGLGHGPQYSGVALIGIHLR